MLESLVVLLHAWGALILWQSNLYKDHVDTDKLVFHDQYLIPPVILVRYIDMFHTKCLYLRTCTGIYTYLDTVLLSESVVTSKSVPLASESGLDKLHIKAKY